MFSLVVTHVLDIQQVINNAFLNGHSQEKIFMVQPEGFIDPARPHHVCRLKKALYDLKQAPRAWFDHLKTALLDWGFTNSVSDTLLFHWRIKNNLLLILVYVDDILVIVEDLELISRLITDLDSQFSLKTLESMN